MLAKRVIPCLDVHAGLVTRGQQFGRAEEDGLRNVGDPVELAIRYNEQGADELVFFDITASSEGRKSIIVPRPWALAVMSKNTISSAPWSL